MNSNKFSILFETDSDDNSLSNGLTNIQNIYEKYNNKNKNNDNNNYNNNNEIYISKLKQLEKKYDEPIIVNNINLEKYFSKNDIDKSKEYKYELKITNKGLYSISKHIDAEWITTLIIDFLKSKKINSNEISIIDGTAGIGGNSINFSKYFKKVHSIEINKTHYDVLNNNIKALSINNIEIYNNNFFDLIDNLVNETNAFFFDPPWGGNSYKNFTYFNLKVGTLPIHSVINILYEQNYKYVFLKAPYNINLSNIHNQIKYNNMNIHNTESKNMLLIIFY
jgi:tRNA/tmRNA/rRNA uracil-C5-methylase (TrmA/RlmC/RlmD family)